MKTRRLALTLAILMVAGLAWAGGSRDTQQSAGPVSTPEGRFQESPLLAGQVSAGTLPSVDERLPQNPMVMKVRDQIGKHGGTLHHVDMGWLVNVAFSSFEPLLAAEPTFSTNFVGSMLESFSANADASVFTFTIRRGLKWSDGVPVTTEDVRFRWEDVLKNTDLTPVFPRALTLNGKPAELEIVDDFTFRIKFSGSYGSFLAWVGGYGRNYTELMVPSHSMRQFHVKYTPLATRAPLIAQEGYGVGEWTKLYTRMHSGTQPWAGNAVVGAPGLWPWVVESLSSPNVRTLVRNPYYFKVDSAGNQLPYFDRVISELVGDASTILAKIVSGEADVIPENARFSDLPLLRQNETAGGYKALILSNWMSTWTVYFPNLNYDEDPGLAALLNDVRFRRALSLGIDRAAISDTIFLGNAQPTAIAPLPGSVFTVPGATTANAAYDPTTANRLLDEIGLRRGADGIRIRPDGKRLALPVDYFEMNPYVTPTTEMVIKYWRDLGIDTSMKQGSLGLWIQTNQANKTFLSLWHHAEIIDPMIWAEGGGGFTWFAPTQEISWAPRWARWYLTGGAEGIEPPAAVKELYRQVDILKYSPNEAARVAAGQALVRSMMENVWMISTGSAPAVVVLKNDLGNVPAASDPNILAMSVVVDLEQAYRK